MFPSSAVRDWFAAFSLQNSSFLPHGYFCLVYLSSTEKIFFLACLCKQVNHAGTP